MSDRVQSPEYTGSTSERPPTKQARRAAAEAAAAAAAASKARWQRLTGALVGVVVVGVSFAALIGFAGRSDDPADTSGAPAPAASAPEATPAATPEASGASPGLPGLPEGMDPRLGQRPTVSAGSGELTELTATPLIEGTGPAAAAGQTVAVNYVGVFYQTGEEFDASWNRSEPLTFQLGAGNVLPGWDQGLVGLKVGSRVQLDIPAELAYGDKPSQPGAPAGPLRFVVDVLAVQ